MSHTESTAPHNPFDVWMTENQVTNTAASKKLREIGYALSIERVRQLRFERIDPRFSLPSWPTIEAVYVLTDGAISPNDWADPERFPGLHSGDTDGTN